MRMNKSGRTRGLVFKAIRSVAAQSKTFTVNDIAMPTDQSGRNIAVLMKLGEIARVKYALRNSGGEVVSPAIYKRTKLLRQPELTNKLTHKRIYDREAAIRRTQGNLRNQAWDNGDMGGAECGSA